MQHRIIGNLAIVMLSALASALLLAGCGGQSATPAVADATATAAAATIAAAFNTPPRNDDDVATAGAATLTSAAPVAITLPSPTPTTLPTAPPPSATPPDTATAISVPPTATPVPTSTAPPAAPLQTPDIQVAAPPSGFQVIQRTGGAIDETEVWTSGSLYVLTSDLSITERGRLVIEPGVIVKFGRGVRIYVSGSLQATGSAANGVVFTSLTDDAFGGDIDNNGDMALPSPGDWNGLYFYDSSRDDKTALSYVRVRYAGEPIVLSNAAPTLTNIQLEQNNVNGYALSSGAWTISRWSNVGNPYVVQNDISLNDMATLTIDPGVVIKFWRSRLYVSGVLLAQGSAEQPLIFTSLADDTVGGDTDNNGDAALPSPSDWNGLYFYNTTNSNKSVLRDAEVRYTQSAYTLADGAAPTIERVVVMP